MKKIVSGIMLTLLLACVSALAFRIQSVKADPRTWIVDDDGEADFHTIQEAVDAASPLDTVYVKPGTYYENVEVNKAVSLVGENRETTIICGWYMRDSVTVTASNATIVNFSIRSNETEPWSYGITIDNVGGCNVSANIVSSSNRGIRLLASSNNYIAGNVLDGNGLVVTYRSFDNTVVNNTVNDLPIIYREGAADQIVESGGQVILVNCLNVTVANTNFSHTTVGVQLRGSRECNIIDNAFSNNYEAMSLSYCSDNRIVGNNISNNDMGVVLVNADSYNIIRANGIVDNGWFGIYAYNSSENTISDNDITGNNDTGIQLQYECSNNTIRMNFITQNHRYGLAINYSSSNIIQGNCFTANYGYGIGLFGPSSNTVYHNNFENNTNQAISPYGSPNVWDDGYPSGGNYWLDYFNRTDLFRGIGQNVTGSDAIADQPYVIDENDRDNYPLMGPIGSSTVTGENVTVFPTNDVGLTFDNVTTGGSTTLNKNATGPTPPPNFRVVDEYYDIETTATYSGNITVRIVYDGSRLTLEEERTLQLLQWDEATHQWINIATFVDTENNIIYGEASHLSIFGVTSAAIPGDVDRNCRVTMGDIVMLCDAFGSTRGPDGNYWHAVHCINCPHSPNCDIDGNGRVDMGDIITACDHFGQHIP